MTRPAVAFLKLLEHALGTARIERHFVSHLHVLVHSGHVSQDLIHLVIPTDRRHSQYLHMRLLQAQKVGHGIILTHVCVYDQFSFFDGLVLKKLGLFYLQSCLFLRRLRLLYLFWCNFFNRSFAVCLFRTFCCLYHVKNYY